MAQWITYFIGHHDCSARALRGGQTSRSTEEGQWSEEVIQQRTHHKIEWGTAEY